MFLPLALSSGDTVEQGRPSNLNSGSENDLPAFARIEKIYIVNMDDVYFLVRMLSMMDHNEYRPCFSF